MDIQFHISATTNNTLEGRYAFSATIEGKDVTFYTNDSELYDYFDLYGENRPFVSDELREEFEAAKMACENAEATYDEAGDNEFDGAKEAYDKAEATYEILRREVENIESEAAKYEKNTNMIIHTLIIRASK